MNLQRTATSGLTDCLSLGAHPTHAAPRARRPHPRNRTRGTGGQRPKATARSAQHPHPPPPSLPPRARRTTLAAAAPRARRSRLSAIARAADRRPRHAQLSLRARRRPALAQGRQITWQQVRPAPPKSRLRSARRARRRRGRRPLLAQPPYPAAALALALGRETTWRRLRLADCRRRSLALRCRAGEHNPPVPQALFSSFLEA
jgi:hypothetical protein